MMCKDRESDTIPNFPPKKNNNPKDQFDGVTSL